MTVVLSVPMTPFMASSWLRVLTGSPSATTASTTCLNIGSGIAGSVRGCRLDPVSRQEERHRYFLASRIAATTSATGVALMWS